MLAKQWYFGISRINGDDSVRFKAMSLLLLIHSFCFIVCIWPLFCNEVRSVLSRFACLRLYSPCLKISKGAKIRNRYN